MTADLILGGVALVAWMLMAYVGAYDVWRGYDALAHAFAGYTIGTASAAAGALFVDRTLLVAVAAALVVSTVASLAWEAFEFDRGIYPWVRRTSLSLAWGDTGGDAAWVALGATLAGMVVAA